MKKKLTALFLAAIMTITAITPAWASEFGAEPDTDLFISEEEAFQSEPEEEIREQTEETLFTAPDSIEQDEQEEILVIGSKTVETGSAPVGYQASDGYYAGESLRNNGDTTLHLLGVNNSKFKVSYGTDKLEPGQKTSLTVRAKGGLKQGTHKETLTIHTEEGPEVSFDAVFYVGARVKQEKAITVDKKEITLHFNREALDNGDYEDDVVEAWDFMEITNIGSTTVNLNLTEMKYFRTPTKIKLKPGEIAPIEIYSKFYNTYAGTYDEVMNITDDSGKINEQVNFHLIVEGPRDLFALDKTDLKFKAKVQDEKSEESQKVSVTNTSESAFSLKMYSKERESAFDISDCAPNVLMPGETGTFTITPKKDTGYGLHQENLKICLSESEKDYKLLTASVRVYPKIASVKILYPELTLRNGAEKTKNGLLLDSANVTLSDGRTVWTEVNWDLENCPYDPDKKEEQTFDVHGMAEIPKNTGNPDGISMELVRKTTVRKYEPMKTPELKSLFTWGNRVSARLTEYVEEAVGYEYVLSNEPDFLKTKKYTYRGENSDTGFNFVSVNPGHYYSACRAFKTENGKRIYTEWSNVLETEVKQGKPVRPVVKKVTVSGNTVKAYVENVAKGDAVKCVLGTSVEDGVPQIGKGMYFEKKGSCVVTFEAVPAGTYYVGAQSCYVTQEGLEPENFYSDWSIVRKAVVKGKAPAAKNMKVCKVSGNTLTVTVEIPKGAVGYEILVGKTAKRIGYQTTANYAPDKIAYSRKGKVKAGQKKVTVTFKNMKKGDYYVGNHTYSLYKNKKVFSRWGNSQRIIVKK